MFFENDDADADGEGSENFMDKSAQRAVHKKKWKQKFETRSHQRKKMKPIFASKSDLKSAFRVLGLSRSSWKWLVMKAQDPKTGSWMFFIDKCLPFGSSISCTHFQHFSNALHHLIEHRLQMRRRVTNYLDDFLFIARTLALCNFMVNQFLEMCVELAVPVSLDKMQWAAELIIFLGILLDGKNLCLAIPIDKKDRALELLTEMKQHKKMTVKQLQNLCGFLNFLCKAIFPGRTFVRRMYAKYSKVVNIHNNDNAARFSNEYKLKQHHHVCLDREFKLDYDIWIEFLNGQLESVVTRPMVDLDQQYKNSSMDIGFYSDASVAEVLGLGAILQNQWIRGDWTSDFIRKAKPSIEYLELYALCAGVIAWESQLVDGHFCVHCDNIAVVHMVNKLTSGCKNCMFLLRLLILNNLKFNRKLTAQYINTRANVLSDALSRNQMTRFRSKGPHMNTLPDKIPEQIWPVKKIWLW